MDFGYFLHINKTRFVVTLTALLFFITDGVCLFKKNLSANFLQGYIFSAKSNKCSEVSYRIVFFNPKIISYFITHAGWLYG